MAITKTGGLFSGAKYIGKYLAGKTDSQVAAKALRESAKNNSVKTKEYYKNILGESKKNLRKANKLYGSEKLKHLKDVLGRGIVATSLASIPGVAGYKKYKDIREQNDRVSLLNRGVY